MDDVVEVQELQANQHAGYQEFGLCFLETTTATHVVSQVSADQQVHDEIEVLPILKGIGHVDDGWMLEFGQQFAFVEHGVDAFLPDDLSLMHFLHRVDLLGFLHAHTPHLAETSLPDDVDAVEVVATNLLTLYLFASFCLFLFEFGKVDFKTVLHVPVGFLGDSRVAAVVLLLPAWRHLFALAGTVVDLRTARHHHTRCTVDARFTGLGGPYREWVEGFWWDWTGILMESTLGRLPR